jgi:hypothetical protein
MRSLSSRYGGFVLMLMGVEAEVLILLLLLQLGSTVVLVFEAPENFQFTVQPGEKLRLGTSIGEIAKA